MFKRKKDEIEDVRRKADKDLRRAKRKEAHQIEVERQRKRLAKKKARRGGKSKEELERLERDDEKIAQKRANRAIKQRVKRKRFLEKVRKGGEDTLDEHGDEIEETPREKRKREKEEKKANRDENFIGKSGRKSGVLADKYSDKDKKLPIRLLNTLNVFKNKQRIDTWVNTVGSGISLGLLNGLARRVTGNDKAQVNFANVFDIFPYTRLFLTIVTIIFTITMWFILVIPLLVIIFALVILLLVSDEIDTEGIDMTGIDIDGIDMDLTSTPDKSGESSNSGTSSGGKSDKTVPNDLNWVFPLFTPNDLIEYNRGWETRWGRFHYGVDFGCSWLFSQGTPHIYAVDDGVVEVSRYNGGWGNMIRIHHDHLGDIRTLYAHMQRASSFKTGDRVNKGDAIGLCGTTGNSTGNHLHFEVWRGSTYITSNTDPHGYIGISHLKGTPAFRRVKYYK